MIGFINRYKKRKFKVVINLKSISPKLTKHGSGLKFVFRDNDELSNSCTQVAYGILEPGEKIEMHKHDTMFEYFYFTRGNGIYKLESKTYKIESGVFFEIPPNTLHGFSSIGNENLEFIYWGIAVV